MNLQKIPKPIVAVVFILTANMAPAASPDGVAFFESKIRPLFLKHCADCHGEKKQRSDLRLDTTVGIAKGGGSGDPMFDRDHPQNSLLLKMVRHEDDVSAMPPKEKLSAAQIADLTQWVVMGTPLPADVDPNADRKNHWAFQPLRDPAVPAGPAASPVDRFLNAALVQNRLAVTPAADKRTLIRRATYDLTGLPPTPQQIEEFLNDNSPQAFERVIDRLLASSAYGERWGRHWLDVARYADSNGLDENVVHGNAWRYRDYVIAAFNADKPFDQFIREQIAGDLLPATSSDDHRENLIALGFLSLGAKVLAEPDPKKMEFDIIDEQVDTVGKAFLGLTLGCARCHDHKFDPISIDDYYALAGIFASSLTMDSYKIVARWHENPIGTEADTKIQNEHKSKVAAVEARIKTLKGKTDADSKKALTAAEAELKKLKADAPEFPTAMGVAEGNIGDIPLFRRGDHLTPGPIVQRRFPEILAGTQQPQLKPGHSGRLELARWLTQPNHPLTSRVTINRIWRWHFGQGLVASVDNFGLLGSKPSHPELLDWLANRFVESGWSVKAMHRLIMLSDAYQRSSLPTPTQTVIAVDTRLAPVLGGVGTVQIASGPKLQNPLLADAGNALLWRFTPRRLEAEEIRDSLLAVSGKLDRSYTGGRSLTRLKNRDYVFNHTSKDATDYDTFRRTVYLPVIRNNLYDVLQLFDATDATVASGDRPTTTVSTQALFWMNSELIHDTAATIATNLLSATSLDDAGRIRELISTAYGRAATEAEVKRYTAVVREFDAAYQASEPDTTKRKHKVWLVVCQVVLAANEFVFIK